jgi:hypothetical protein
MHPVDKGHGGDTRRSEHHRAATGRTEAGVGGAVVHPPLCLDLHDATLAATRRVLADDARSQEIPRDLRDGQDEARPGQDGQADGLGKNWRIESGTRNDVRPITAGMIVSLNP